MTNRELHDALKAELSIPYEELIIKHPTIADLGTEFPLGFLSVTIFSVMGRIR